MSAIRGYTNGFERVELVKGQRCCTSTTTRLEDSIQLAFMIALRALVMMGKQKKRLLLLFDIFCIVRSFSHVYMHGPSPYR